MIRLTKKEWQEKGGANFCLDEMIGKNCFESIGEGRYKIVKIIRRSFKKEMKYLHDLSDNCNFEIVKKMGRQNLHLLNLN